MAQINYKFRFSPASQKQGDGTLANVKIELWVGNVCVVATTGWQLRASNKQGESPWLAGPRYQMGRGTQNEKWIPYILFWPKRTDDGGEDTQAQYNDLRARANTAYNEWVAAGSPRPQYGNQQNQQQQQQAPGHALPAAGVSLAPNIPTAQPATPQLPQGWQTGIDTAQTPPKRWYRDANGEGYWEGDPRLAALLQPQAPPPPPVPAAPPVPPAPPSLPNNPYDSNVPAAPTPFTQPGDGGGWSPPPAGPALG